MTATYRPVDLGEDLEPVAALTPEGAAEDFLRLATRVDVGGVEGGDAAVERCANTGRGLVLLDLAAVRQSVAVGDLTDDQAAAAEVSEFHANDPTSTATGRFSRC